MALQHATDANFTDTIKNGLTLVDFWATWCGPCRMIAPYIAQLAEEYDGAVHAVCSAQFSNLYLTRFQM